LGAKQDLIQLYLRQSHLPNVLTALQPYNSGRPRLNFLLREFDLLQVEKEVDADDEHHFLGAED
jgi:hypothetical protein